MKYNRTHNQYRLGLGLFFMLKFGHPDNPQGWICLSNIPGINQKKLQAKTKQDAGIEVMTLFLTEIDFDYDASDFE